MQQKQMLTYHSPSGGGEQGQAAAASGSTRLRVRPVDSDCPSLDSQKRLRTTKKKKKRLEITTMRHTSSHTCTRVCKGTNSHRIHFRKCSCVLERCMQVMKEDLKNGGLLISPSLIGMQNPLYYLISAHNGTLAS